jgi:hypothetical protein
MGTITRAGPRRFYFLTPHSSPGIINGQWVLHNYGVIVKVLNETEYHYAKAGEMRFISGIRLAFYGLSMAVLFPFAKGGVGKLGPDQPA